MTPAEPTIKPEPRYEHLEALDIVGLPKNFTSETRGQIPALWERFVKWIGQVPHQVGGVTYGVIRNNDKGRGFYYMAGVAVSATTAVPDDLRLVQLPAGDYVVFTHVGPVSKLFETMCAIYTQWAPDHSEELADAACFERYSEDFDPRTGAGTIEVWLPLVDQVPEDTP